MLNRISTLTKQHCRNEMKRFELLEEGKVCSNTKARESSIFINVSIFKGISAAQSDHQKYFSLKKHSSLKLERKN